MEQTLDLAQQTVEHCAGEHFLRVEPGDTLASVFDRLRDHRSSAAIYGEGSDWRIVSAENLPGLLLQGPEALQQPVSTLAQPLCILPSTQNLAGLRQALNTNSWVGVLHDGNIVALLNWASWARFNAGHRLAGSYTFSPEWGRTDIPSIAPKV